MGFELTADVRACETPVRGRGSLDPAGFRLLRDVGSTHHDGAEARVLEIIEEAADVTSSSEELIIKAVGWAQRYHLDPTRANIVRAVDLPADARVLEVGAGCGAVTRYLGERCSLVDAVEPVPSRATAARERCRDLDSVQVFVGEVEDVPATPTYDVVVVIGVPEYVGNGTRDRAPYLDFLAKLAARLVDGGTLVLAIENQLGVKYVAGAPEDHTNRAYDSLEGYPRGGRARTFPRAQLEQLFIDSGLQPYILIAFPDYKLTRAVFGRFPEHARSLLYRIPRLPSPDWRAKRSKTISEAALWRTLVEAGLEFEFGNSFLVLGGKGGRSSLWPDSRAGVFYSTTRRAPMVMQTIVAREGDGRARLWRTRVAPSAGNAGSRVMESDADFQPGIDFTEVLAIRGVEAAGPLMTQWLELLDERLAARADGLIDFVPHNLVLDGQGDLHAIDIELTGYPVDRGRVLARGVFYLALNAAPLASPSRWDPCKTMGELMTQLGRHVGLPADGSWSERFIVDEARLQAAVRSGPPAGLSEAGWLQRLESSLRSAFVRPLSSLPLGERMPDELAARTARLTRARADLDASRAETRQARAELAIVRAELERTRRSLKSLRASAGVRAVMRARTWVDQALPVGSLRRRGVRRLVRQRGGQARSLGS